MHRVKDSFVNTTYQDDVIHRYQVGVEKRMKEYVKKTTRQKYAKNDQYAAFKQGIYVRVFSGYQNTSLLTSLLAPQEVNHPDEAMPPITEFIPRGYYGFRILLTFSC